MYEIVKLIHIGCAALSVTGFSIRAALNLMQSELMHCRITKIAPHVVDTVLLASAVYLAVKSGQYPGDQPWLTAKVLALPVYIVLGIIALRVAKTTAGRMTATAAALCTALYIICAALTRSSTPWLG